MSRAKMSGCMTARRLIAATHMSASPTYPQVNPGAAGFYALLAAARTRRNGPDRVKMRTVFTHGCTALLKGPVKGLTVPLFGYRPGAVALIAPAGCKFTPRNHWAA